MGAVTVAAATAAAARAEVVDAVVAGDWGWVAGLERSPQAEAGVGTA